MPILQQYVLLQVLFNIKLTICLTFFLSEKFVMYPALSSLSEAIPKLLFIPNAESMAVQFLQMIPSRRISALQALHHQYFGDLPLKLFEQLDGTCM